MTFMKTVKIKGSFAAPGTGPVGLCYDGRFLWNADFSGGKIYRIDPETVESDVVLVCPGNLSGIAWDGRSLWQSLHDGGTLRRINPETNDFDQTIMVWEHGWLSGVAWDGNYLWSASQQHGKLFQIDPENGDVLKTIAVPVASGGLDYHDGSLWLGIAYPMSFDPHFEQFNWEGDEQKYAIVCLDPATGSEQARYSLDFMPMGLAWIGDTLWLTHVAERKLHCAQIE
jgi:outer membrane protein assembly factor BamB